MRVSEQAGTRWMNNEKTHNEMNNKTKKQQ